MSWSHLINKNSTSSVPWEKHVIYCWKVLYAKFLWNCFCGSERSNLPLLSLLSRLPSQSRGSCFSLRFKGGAGGLALAGKWEMNLEETSSVTLETSGTAMLQTEGLEKQIPKRPALCRTCPRASPAFLVSSPSCKGRATAVCYGRRV